ncbi:DUF4073 domain-containing protein [Microbacterium sp. G2-8]|uniref:DUF4073 domain-containing protein n=1 Tax=Microbacterium sp. G2-8 TaxID=2842454 RepID=UPI001C89859D|nr:DUF4073 domain-containing protein [Microbacterium sp. G2-8]
MKITRTCAVGGLLVAALALPALPAVAAPAPPASAVVSSDGSAIVVDDADLAAGDALSVSYETDAPHELNWIGVYPAGVTPGDTASTQWAYTPDPSGTVAFDGLAAGDWDVYLLAEDGYGVLAGPARVAVSPDPGAAQPGDPDGAVDIAPVAMTRDTDEVVAREAFSADGAEGWSASGWQFLTRDEWTAGVDEMRTRFGRADGTIAVADPQQFGGSFDATLASAPVDVTGLGSVRLSFDSHYRGSANQSGAVSVSFDGGETSEVLRLDSESIADGYDARQMNGTQDIVIEVPSGAREAVFSWTLTGDETSRYWAIDSVAVHEVLAEAVGEPTQAWVMSDIQGHPQDWQHALGDYAEIAPEADAMAIVGDVVNSGTTREWDEISDVMGATAHLRPRQTIAAIGNHERYAPGGFEANRDRFLTFAERDRVWDEYVIEGPSGDLPVIMLGQEFAGPPDVPMSEEQVRFLEERLAHWTAQGSQVLVLTHFPLGDTVSASWIPHYADHHQMNDRLTSILGNYPNAVVMSGHTHYPAELGDWAVQRRTTDGHADGFWAVNTIAMHVEWDARGESTSDITEVVTRDINQGLTVDAYGDRLVVTAHDFETDEQLRQVTIPNPLIESETDEQIVAGTPEIVSEHHRGIKPGAWLTVDEGSWPAGTEFSYRWLADGRPIAGETSNRFHLTGRYKGVDIAVEVTGAGVAAESEPVRID